MHLICVYTAACRDVEDLTRAVVRLRVLGFGGRLSCKEDGATLARGYGRGAARSVVQAGSVVPDRRRDPIQPSAVRVWPDGRDTRRNLSGGLRVDKVVGASGAIRVVVWPPRSWGSQSSTPPSTGGCTAWATG
jgi:hypothetical protein